MKEVLVTGAAGFIGFHLSQRLLEEGYKVVGLDIMSDYYDVNLKKARLSELEKYDSFKFILLDLQDSEGLERLFEQSEFEYVVNLAAQAGVRYSIENPKAYIGANIVGFSNLIEVCKNNNIKHFLYASSSSVYGANEDLPFSVNDNVDHPMSIYAATKKSNELIAHSYSSLFKLPVTGLRFFTVYGPFGRPDMALFLFTKAILEGKEIQVFNEGKMKRDFTYVDDIVESIFRLLEKPALPNQNWTGENPDAGSSYAPYELYNIGNNSPVELMDFIKAIENKLGKKAKMNLLPLQPGDVPDTFANVDALIHKVQYKPNTSIEQGIGQFIDWYLEYYKPKF
ncbi:MAG: NAD-dependent epimerase [Reichenbachiella sp.]